MSSDSSSKEILEQKLTDALSTLEDANAIRLRTIHHDGSQNWQKVTSKINACRRNLDAICARIGYTEE